jgi:ABC-2 type transport system permease protein
MFAHIFVTRFKCIVRDRQTMFWTLLFPIILATLFHFAFADIGKAYAFSKFNIAVINNSQFQKDTAFKSALNSVSGKSESSTSQVLFNVDYCDKAKADALLKDSKIEGYIDYDGSPKLIVKTSGFNQSILKSFLDEYKQTKTAVTTIITNNPSSAASIMSDVSDDTVYLKEVSQTKAKPDIMLNYFYALIGMACLYGGFFGLKEVTAIQANQSAQGARVNLAPVNKLKVFISSICAATAVQVICVYILFAFLSFALKIDFGTKVPFILLACLVSSFTGVSYGAFIASVIKGGEGLKTAVLISLTMVLSFLSGLMMVQMKYIVQKNAPALALFNPANIISDTFYSLYYYDTYMRYFTNIGILLGFSAVFYFGVYLVMRRQRYESI